jgi:hypothetical protein
MSRLGKALCHRPTGERAFIPQPMNYVAITERHTPGPLGMDYAVKYEISATFVTSVSVQERDLGALAAAVERAKRTVIREVFGEFVGPLHEAIHLIDRCEFQKAQRVIEQVIRSFDSPEPLTLKA